MRVCWYGRCAIEQRQVADRAELVLLRVRSSVSLASDFGLAPARQACARRRRARAASRRRSGTPAAPCPGTAPRRRRRRRSPRACSACSSPPWKIGCSRPAPMLQTLGPLNRFCSSERLRAEAAAQRDLRIQVGGGDADLRAGLVQQRLGGADVGPLAHQRRGQADRQFGRQVQLGRGRTPAGPASLGNAPASTASWWRVCASCFSSGGSVARVCATCVCCATHVDARSAA